MVDVAKDEVFNTSLSQVNKTPHLGWRVQLQANSAVAECLGCSKGVKKNGT